MKRQRSGRLIAEQEEIDNLDLDTSKLKALNEEGRKNKHQETQSKVALGLIIFYIALELSIFAYGAIFHGDSSFFTKNMDSVQSLIFFVVGYYFAQR